MPRALTKLSRQGGRQSAVAAEVSGQTSRAANVYGSAMIYLPSRCGSCGKVVLVAAGELLYGDTPCLACGGDLSPLAGCAFPEGDLTLFEELSSLVEKSNLRGLEARRLAFALERVAHDGGVDACFAWLIERIPALEPTRLMLEAHRDRRQQVVTMLTTILHGSAASPAVRRSIGSSNTQGASP